jgi:hypothetical protein
VVVLFHGNVGKSGGANEDNHSSQCTQNDRKCIRHGCCDSRNERTIEWIGRTFDAKKECGKCVTNGAGEDGYHPDGCVEEDNRSQEHMRKI